MSRRLHQVWMAVRPRPAGTDRICGSRSPAISASTIARPDWVSTLEATEAAAGQ